MIRDSIRGIKTALPLIELGIYKAEPDNSYLTRAMAGCLSPERMRRIERLPEAVRPERIAASYLICSRLSDFTGTGMGEIEFTYGPHGKPRIKGAGPEFSLSHSGNLILYAVGTRPVGVDAEYIRPVREAFIRRICSAAELDYIFGQGGGADLRRFFTLWTCKEAVIKARGLSVAGMRDISLELSGGTPKLSDGQFELEVLDLGADICAAICADTAIYASAGPDGPACDTGGKNDKEIH